MRLDRLVDLQFIYWAVGVCWNMIFTEETRMHGRSQTSEAQPFYLDRGSVGRVTPISLFRDKRFQKLAHDYKALDSSD